MVPKPELHSEPYIQDRVAQEIQVFPNRIPVSRSWNDVAQIRTKFDTIFLNRKSHPAEQEPKGKAKAKHELEPNRNLTEPLVFKGSGHSDIIATCTYHVTLYLDIKYNNAPRNYSV